MKPSLLIQRGLTVALWLAALGVAAYVSTQRVWEADWTAGNRNTLTADSRKLLETLPEPIRFTAFVFPNAEVKREVAARIAPYQRARPSIALEFVDPAKDPQRVRELGIGENGEVIIEYQGRQENLRALSEQSISSALQRLAFTSEAQIRFLGGHGERDPKDAEQAGYSVFAGDLANKGLRAEVFNFTQAASIPDDTDVLVVAAPQRAPLPAEIDRLVDYVQRGGNLLWIYDPDSPPLPKLADALGIAVLPGTVIYQDYDLLGTGHPAMALVADYPGHAITREMVDITLFPLAAGVGLQPDTPWQTQRLLSTPARSWLETGDLDAELVYESATDLNGPVSIGFALERPAPGASESRQRVVVIGDSDFLSNGFVGQLGNRRLGFNILQWLASRDAQIDIDVPAAPDTTLSLSAAQSSAIALIFILLLPGALLGMGLLRWWQRRAHRA